MIPEDIEALALADAVGALDPDEQRELATLIAALPPEAQAAVARLYDTVTAVAASAAPVAPPAHVRERVLAVDRVKGTATLVLKAGPGAVYPSHPHHGAEECYVLSGSLTVDGRTLHAGDFHHADADSDHGELTTVDGAEVLVVGAIEDYLPGF